MSLLTGSAAMLAIGRFDMHYRLNYFDYREAKTSGRVRGIGGGGVPGR